MVLRGRRRRQAAVEDVETDTVGEMQGVVLSKRLVQVRKETEEHEVASPRCDLDAVRLDQPCAAIQQGNYVFKIVITRRKSAQMASFGDFGDCRATREMN